MKKPVTTDGAASKSSTPAVPWTLPDLTELICAQDFGHPRFCEAVNGEWVLGIYGKKGTMVSTLLWADSKADLFWDVGLQRYVNSPAFYVRITCQPKINAEAGYPVIDGMVCPF